MTDKLNKFKEKYYADFNLTDELPGIKEDNVEILKTFIEYGKENGGVINISPKLTNCIEYVKSQNIAIVSEFTDDVLNDVANCNVVDYVVVETYTDDVLIDVEPLKN